ncbi:MAG: purine-binding chemotaxis protein CheW [Gammaproteobacteria bacterium]|nr:purine-binding chemotaxis protein CheW [Gammaproteobacteria bacterium]NIW47313.1 chemotaxis protein CheW [Gammaproteobacteria bacterium]NIX00892.1 chemotaxis protein CheW [Phycisphaerae bacterium]
MSEIAEDIAQQYLTFCLGNETFAVDVAKTREVIDGINITDVPQTPDYMLGVINLRGGVVPVIDMRRKFSMEAKEHTVETCIIVLEVNVEGEAVIVGALADSVSEVLEIKAGQIEPPPRLGSKLNTEFIQGMGNIDDNFVILLDIDKVFSVEELELVREMNDERDEVEAEV